jgi:hypothetical protein
MVLVVPEIMLDAKSYNHRERECAEDALKQCWHPQSAVELEFQSNLKKLFFELGHFHRKEGPYDNKRIWTDTYALTGQSHLWHNENMVQFKYMSLGFKILGIGAAERSWGDVKCIIGDRRLSLGSGKTHKQSVIYTSNCIHAKKKELNLDDHTWKAWDLAMDDFNSHLEQYAVWVPSLNTKPAVRETNDTDGCFGHFIQTGVKSNNHRLFLRLTKRS